MNCTEIQNLISAYLDGELQPKEAQGVRDHLQGCESCQKEFQSLAKTWEMLDEWKDIEPQPGYVSRFWTQASLQSPWHERFFKDVQEGLTKRRLVPALMTACVIIIVGLLSIRHYFVLQKSNELMVNLSEEELEMVENIELAENYELIQDLDLIEDLEIIENLDTLEIS